MNVSKQTHEKPCLVPHGMGEYMVALHYAISHLVDSNAVYHKEREEMYAVFDLGGFTQALGFLCVGFAKYTARPVLTMKEEKEQILIILSVSRRRAGAPLASRDLLPECEDLRLLLVRLLRENGAVFDLRDSGDQLVLTVAVPRFLAQRYVVAAGGGLELCSHFYTAMRLLAGLSPVGMDKNNSAAVSV